MSNGNIKPKDVFNHQDQKSPVTSTWDPQRTPWAVLEKRSAKIQTVVGKFLQERT